jgi:hypothetical protein
MIERQAALQINTSIHSFVLEDCIMNHVSQMVRISKFIKAEIAPKVCQNAKLPLDISFCRASTRSYRQRLLLVVVSHHFGSVRN